MRVGFYVVTYIRVVRLHLLSITRYLNIHSRSCFVVDERQKH